MFSKIKSLSSKLHKYRSRMSSEKWLNYLRQSGASIGEGTVIHANPAFVQIDTTRPWLMKLEKMCR